MTDRTALTIMEEFFRSVIYPGMREHLATASQTDFTVNGVWDSALDTPIVFVNGNRLWSGVSWLNATTVRLTPGAALNDRVLVLVSPGTGAGYLAAATGQLLGDLDCNGQRLTNLAPSSTDSDAVRRDEMIAFLGVLADAANYLRRDGTLPMTGALNFGNNHGSNLPLAAITDDAANGDRPASWGAVRAYGVAKFLALAGGTMSGELAMGSNKITGLADGTDPQDAATVAQATGAVALGSNGNARYLSNGNWTVPAGVTRVFALLIGGGGGGGHGSTSGGGDGYDGGNGGVCMCVMDGLTPGAPLPIVIGQPGIGGYYLSLVSYAGTDGGDTTFNGAIAYGGTAGSNSGAVSPAHGTDGTFDAHGNALSPIPAVHPSDFFADHGLGGPGNPDGVHDFLKRSNGHQGSVTLWW
jgi:hypothetical protein